MAAEQPRPNPIDYKIWGNMSIRQKVQNVDDLRQHLIGVWAGVEHSVVDDGTDQWRRRFELQEESLTRPYSLWHIRPILVTINCNKLSWNLLLNKIFVSDRRLFPDIYLHKVVT